MLTISSYIPEYSGSALKELKVSTAQAPIPWKGTSTFTAVGSSDFGGGAYQISTLGDYDVNIRLAVTGATGVPAAWTSNGFFNPTDPLSISSMRVYSYLTLDYYGKVKSSNAYNELAGPTIHVFTPNIYTDVYWFHQWAPNSAGASYSGVSASGYNYQNGTYNSSYIGDNNLNLTIEAHPTSTGTRTTAIFNIQSVRWTATGIATSLNI